MAEADSKRPRIYVQRSLITLGEGSTSRNISSESYYQAEELLGGQVRLILLDNNDQPTGLVEIVDQAELAQGYELVPHYFETKKTPQEKAIEQKLATGQAHLEREEYHSAEYEFDNVLKIDDRRIEAHVGKGESLMGQGDIQSAREAFAKASQIDELYEKKNKHLLNTFGITLRRNGLYDQAIETYRKAQALDPGDENLYYNMARAHYEWGQKAESVVLLKKVLHLNPGHGEAAALLKLAEKR